MSTTGIFSGPAVALFLPARILPEAAQTAKSVEAAQKVASGAKTIKEADVASSIADSAALRRMASQATPPPGVPHANIPPELKTSMQKVLTGADSSGLAAKKRLKRDLVATRSLRNQKPHRLQKRGPPNVLAYVRQSQCFSEGLFPVEECASLDINS